MHVRVTIDVVYDEATQTSEDALIYLLEKEVDRCIQDGMLLFDEVIDEYSMEVERIDS